MTMCNGMDVTSDVSDGLSMFHSSGLTWALNAGDTHRTLSPISHVWLSSPSTITVLVIQIKHDLGALSLAHLVLVPSLSLSPALSSLSLSLSLCLCVCVCVSKVRCRATQQLLVDIDVLAHTDYFVGSWNSGLPGLIDMRGGAYMARIVARFLMSVLVAMKTCSGVCAIIWKAAEADGAVQ
jgi:hypothetical protein